MEAAAAGVHHGQHKLRRTRRPSSFLATLVAVAVAAIASPKLGGILAFLAPVGGGLRRSCVQGSLRGDRAPRAARCCERRVFPRDNDAKTFSRLSFADRFKGSGVQKDLDLSVASKVLMGLGSIVAAVSYADSVGVIWVADMLEVFDAQALIADGQAAAASVTQDEDLIQMQLSLQDGTQRIINLFMAKSG